MIEQLKPVSNPLSIIAIFAGLAEVAGAVTVAFIDSELQAVFVWFLMVFPMVLVIGFFLTLNFNSARLYAPSDFREEANFMQALRHGVVASEMQALQEQLMQAQMRLIEEGRRVKTKEDADGIVDLAVSEIVGLSARVTDAATAVDDIAPAAGRYGTGSHEHHRFDPERIEELLSDGLDRSMFEIFQKVGSSPEDVATSLKEYMRTGIVERISVQGQWRYRLACKPG